jgi:hypothetical protein
MVQIKHVWLCCIKFSLQKKRVTFYIVPEYISNQRTLMLLFLLSFSLSAIRHQHCSSLSPGSCGATDSAPSSYSFSASMALGDGRPSPEDRRFVSPAIDSIIDSYVPRLSSKNISIMFNQSFPNTLDTTVYFNETAFDTFVITGDINAMWLRDSTNQILPYVPFVSQDATLSKMICGIVNRQLRSVLIDRYANAFNPEANGEYIH